MTGLRQEAASGRSLKPTAAMKAAGQRKLAVLRGGWTPVAIDQGYLASPRPSSSRRGRQLPW